MTEETNSHRFSFPESIKKLIACSHDSGGIPCRCKDGDIPIVESYVQKVFEEQHARLIAMENEREQFLLHMENLQSQNDDILVSLNSFVEESDAKAAQSAELKDQEMAFLGEQLEKAAMVISHLRERVVRLEIHFEEERYPQNGHTGNDGGGGGSEIPIALVDLIQEDASLPPAPVVGTAFASQQVQQSACCNGSSEARMNPSCHTPNDNSESVDALRAQVATSSLSLGLGRKR